MRPWGRPRGRPAIARARRLRLGRGVLGLSLTCTFALSACGRSVPPAAAPSSTTTAAPARGDPVGSKLTLPQALQLAQVLYRNYTEGGARVVVHVPYSATVDVTITGAVDFDHHEGHLVVVTTSGPDHQTQDVDYTADRVYERGGPVVAAEIAASGRRGVRWVARVPDEQTRPIDKIIAVLVALASPERDNPLLIQQGSSTWQGTGTLDGTTVDRYHYSQAITYEVGAGDGLLREFLGTLQGFAGTVTVELSDWGPRTLAPPAPAQVISAPTSTAG